MSAGPRLPYELFSAIIPLLKDDKNSLVQCSIVSRAFRALSQPELYADVHLANDNVVDLFYYGTIESQNLRNLVTAIHLGREAFDSSALFQLLEHLPNLRKLGMGHRNVGYPPLMTMWDLSISYDVMMALYEYAFKTITHLDLRQMMEVPIMSVLSACPKLTHLALRCSDTAFEPWHGQVLAPHPLRSLLLEKFDVGDLEEESQLDRFLSTSQCTIEHLTFRNPYPSCRDFSAIDKLLNRYRRSVKHLDLGNSAFDILEHPGTQEHDIRLETIPLLQIMEVTIPLATWSKAERHATFLQWLAKQLIQISRSLSAFTILRINITSKQLKQNILDVEAWSALDQALQNKSLASMKRVQFVTASQINCALWREYIPTVLARTHQRGLLEFSVNNDLLSEEEAA